MRETGVIGLGFAPDFSEQLDDGCIAIVPGDIEHGEACIAGLRMLVDGVYVCAVIDEELHGIDGEIIGDRGVHERRSAQQVVTVGVGSVIEQGTHVAGVGKNGGVIE